MTDMFEFEGVKLEKVQINTITCYRCYFSNREDHWCAKKQHDGEIPKCVTNGLTYNFIKVKDKE